MTDDDYDDDQLYGPPDEPQQPDWEETSTRCDHADAPLVQRRQGNGVVVVVRQCQRCGLNLGAVKKASVTTPLSELPWWDEARRERWWALRAEARQRESDAWHRAYDAYLASPQWRELRRKVLARCHGVCEGCGERPAVQIHHLTYARTGYEMLFDLAAVCLECHEKIHPHLKDHHHD